MFLSPLGLLALIGVPAVVGLYLFRRRTRTREVSALFLWDAPDLSPVAGRRVEKLKTEASFWCEILAALCLGLLVAGPRGCGTRTTEHLVCVLDGSASMSALDDGTSAADRARAWIADELDGLSARSLVTLVESGPRARVLAGPGVHRDEARAALEAYVPSQPNHSMGPALDLARELARDGRILVATDQDESTWADDRTHLRSFGKPQANVAIVHSVRERSYEGAGDIAWVTIENFSSKPARRRLTATVGDGTGTPQVLEFQPMQRRTIEFDVPDRDADFVVELEPDDLTLDDSVRLLPPPSRTLELYVGTSPEVTRSLGLDERGELWADLVGDAVVALTRTDAHLALGPSAGLGTNTWSLSFGRGTDTAWIGPFLLDRSHPLTEGVHLEGTVWMGSADVEPPGTPVISSGNRALLAEERIGNRRLLRANLDPVATNLARSPDWPILLSNWSEARRAELPGPSSVNLVQGETLSWLGLSPGEHRLTLPDGSERFLSVGERLVIDRLDQLGEYRLFDAEANELGRFVVRYEDATESNLRGRLAGERTTDVARAEVATRHDPLPKILWAIALAALLVDVFVLRPRGTTQANSRSAIRLQGATR